MTCPACLAARARLVAAALHLPPCRPVLAVLAALLWAVGRGRPGASGNGVRPCAAGEP